MQKQDPLKLERDLLAALNTAHRLAVNTALLPYLDLDDAITYDHYDTVMHDLGKVQENISKITGQTS